MLNKLEPFGRKLKTDFKLDAVTAHLFVSPTEKIDISKILSQFYPKVSDVFSGSPFVLPELSENVPKDVPRVQFVSTDKNNVFSISEARVFFQSKNLQSRGTSALQVFEDAIKYFDFFVGISEIQILRLAGVTHKFMKADDPGSLLAKHFCSENRVSSPFDRPENFEIHAHKTYKYKSFDINSWARVKSVEIKAGGRGIAFEQDINTIEQATNHDFGKAEYSDFFTGLSDEIRSIELKYFPTVEGDN